LDRRGQEEVLEVAIHRKRRILHGVVRGGTAVSATVTAPTRMAFVFA